MTPSELGVEQRLAWNILRRGAIIRDGAPGTYFLDELSWEASRSRRKRMAIVLVTVALLLALIPFILVTVGQIGTAAH